MAQSLELLLIQFLMPDNDARRQAEEQIRRLARDPAVVPALVHHLRTAKTPSVRQLAAVLLRKKLAGHWAKLTPATRQSLKLALLDSITLDHSQPVRRASANVVSIVAKYTVHSGEWPELLPFLFQCSHSTQEDHREIALILFSSLTETIGTAFQSHLADLQPILLRCLQDETSSRVRVAALKAIGSYIEFINDGGNVKLFRDFIPSILSVSRQSLANGEEDVASIAFEIFDEIIESPAPLMGDSVISIVQFSLEVCSCSTLEINVRHQAIQIISWLAKYKPSVLRKEKLIVPILQVMCPLLTEAASEEDEDADLAADRAAAEVIDTMAMNLSKHIFLPVLEFASVSFRHSNPKFREAAVTSLGVTAEGCCEYFKGKLEECLQILLEAMKDQEQMVRGAASFALGQFAEHLQPEILSHYSIVLPCILNALEDPSDEVKEKSYYALAAFCEDMGESIIPYVDPLMGRLLTSLQQSPRNIQETCMSAIGSVAAAAEQAFLPYAEKVLEMMKSFLVLTNDEDLCARARAIEIVGIVAMAIGRTRMEPVLPPFMEAAILGFELDYSELREYTHGFFSNVAEVLGDGFTQYLQQVVPLAFSSCNLDDGSAVDIDDDSIENGVGAVSSDDDTEDEPKVRSLSVRTGILDEKAAATQAIGFFALHTKRAYAPYVDESMRILVRHSGYFHEDVRLQAITALKNVLTAVRDLPPENSDIAEKQKDVLDSVMNIYIKAMKEDDDKEVVAQACTNLADIARDCGYNAMESYLPSFAEATLVLLRKEASCQQIDSDGDTEDAEIDHDEVLMDAVSDLLPAFAKVMGPKFEPMFAMLFNPLMRYAKAGHPPQDRTMVVACLAEVAQEMGSPIYAYVDKIMPLVLKELSSSDSGNRRNAAFCIGEMCRNGGAAALKYYGDALRALYPLFSEAEPDNAVRDNAAGAVARMIMVQPQTIPLNQVLPVFLKALPLKEDLAESMAVYSCLCNLLVSSNPQILPLIPDVVQVFAQVAISPAENDEVKKMVGMAVSHLISVYGQQMQPILTALPPACANALATFAAKR